MFHLSASRKAIVGILCAGAAQAASLPAVAGDTPSSGSSISQLTQQLQQDARVYIGLAQAWVQLQNEAQAYGSLQNYGNPVWAGPGPWAFDPRTGTYVICHNPRWDTVTSKLDMGALNIAGDIEGSAYAIESLSADWAITAANLQAAEAQAGLSVNIQSIMQEANMAQQALDPMLNALGNQVAAAMSPGSSLSAMPFNSWQVGLGPIPDISTFQFVPGSGKNFSTGFSRFFNGGGFDGAIPQYLTCPTGTATGGEPIAGPQAAISGVQLMLSENTAMAQVINISTTSAYYTIPGSRITPTGSYYQERESFTATLGHDTAAISSYMAPTDASITSLAQHIQQITPELIDTQP